MLIEVRTDSNIDGSDQLTDHVKAVAHAALDRHSDHIRRVDVHLSDASGSKTGQDGKCCMIEVRRNGREPIIIKHQESTMDQAIQGAFHDLKKSVESAFGKESIRDGLRDHH